MGCLAKSFMQASAPRTKSRAACSTGKHFYSPQLKPYHSSINTFSCSKRARNTVPSSETPHNDYMAQEFGSFFKNTRNHGLSPSTPERAQRRQQGIPNGPAEVRLKYANDAIRKGSSSLEICLGLLKVTMEQTQEKVEGNHVLQTPLWIVIIRGFQFLISLIIVGLCGRLMHDATLDEEALSLAIAIISWIVIAYVVFTEKIPSLRSAYHIIAVLSLDALLMVLWLAAWAATAARRAKYVVPVNAYGCVDDGSLTDSKTCNIFKRDGENVILFKSGLAMLAAVAGLGALVWILFIVTFVWTLVMFLRGRKEGRFAVNLAASPSPNNNYQMETKVNEGQPMVQPVQPQGVPQQQYQQQPTQGQFVPQQQQQQYPPQGTPSPYQPAQSPYQQQGAYPPPAAPYSPQDQQYQGQQNYGQYPPQQYQQPPQPQGSELDGQTNYSTPPPASMSPPPQHYGSELDGQTNYAHPPPASMSPPPQPQPYPPQAYPQQ